MKPPLIAQTSDPPAVATVQKPALLLGYVGTLALTLAAVGAGLSTLSFITLSRVRAGQSAQEAWTLGFILDSPTGRPRPLDAAIASELARSIFLKPSGSLEILSASIDVTSARVSWTEGRTTYTAPGGRLVSRVTWRARTNAADGQPGEIDVDVAPSAIVTAPNRVNFRTGNYEKTDDGRYVLRWIKTYPTQNRVIAARFLASLIPAFPVALLLHALLWPWQLKRAKRAWIAKVTPPDPSALPRTFYPSPISPWVGWTFVAFVAGVLGSILTAYGIIHREADAMLDHVMIVIESIALSLGLLVAGLTLRSGATVHVDRRVISCARGVIRPRWITARWHELRSASPKSRDYRGNTLEWLEITFPNGQRYKVASDTVGYETLKEMVTKFYWQ